MSENLDALSLNTCWRGFFARSRKGVQLKTQKISNLENLNWFYNYCKCLFKYFGQCNAYMKTKLTKALGYSCLSCVKTKKVPQVKFLETLLVMITFQ